MRHTCRDVIPVNAARMFRNPAPILSNPRVAQTLLRLSGSSVLELGAGCLRNALHLQRLGFDVSVLEVKGIEDRFPEQYETFTRFGGSVYYSLPTKRFHWSLATFVIETICNPKIRSKILRGISRQLKNDGFLLLSVRGPRDLVTAVEKGIPLSDGYLTPGKTFSRAFTPKQLERLLRRSGFDNNKFLHKPSTLEPELVHVIAMKKKGR